MYFFFFTLLKPLLKRTMLKILQWQWKTKQIVSILPKQLEKGQGFKKRKAMRDFEVRNKYPISSVLLCLTLMHTLLQRLASSLVSGLTYTPYYTLPILIFRNADSSLSEMLGNHHECYFNFIFCENVYFEIILYQKMSN